LFLCYVKPVSQILEERGGQEMREKEKKRRAVLWAVFLLIAAPGCSALGSSALVKRCAIDGLLPTVEDLVDTALRSDDRVLVRATLEADLILLDTFVARNPGSRQLLVLASKLYGYYAFGFVVDEDLDRARALYWKGIALGKKALSFNRGFQKRIDEGEPLYRAVDRLDPEKDVPAAFVTALNMGLLLICSLEVPEALGEANSFRCLAEWVVRHDETYHYGAPHTLLGVYFGIMPAVLGGGEEKARREFLRAIEINDRWLLHYYFYARYVPTLIGDEELFDQLIGHVLGADSRAVPDSVILNEVAKVKARLLQQNRRLYF
jgi:hypothetical protein